MIGITSTNDTEC